MGYLIFRNASTANLLDPADNTPKVYVSQMPSHRKAAMRNTEYYIKGRDGALHVDEGYQNFDITVQLILINASEGTRLVVNAWADGTGKLVSSDDLSRAYMASVKSQVVWQRQEANQGFYDTATITFSCQPYMVEALDSQVTMTETGALLNPGSMNSYPLLQINGSGDAAFEVNGNAIEIDDMTAGTSVYIDCETGYVYTQAGATTIRGEIPHFEMGSNTITFGSGVSSIVVTPRWRWI